MTTRKEFLRFGFALLLFALAPTGAAAQYCTHLGDCSMSVVGTVDIPIGAKITIQCDWSMDPNLCCTRASAWVDWGDGDVEGLDGSSGSRTVDHYYQTLGNKTIKFTLKEGDQFCYGPVLCEKTSSIVVVPCDLSGCSAKVDHIQNGYYAVYKLSVPWTDCSDKYHLWVDVTGGPVGCYASKCTYDLGVGPGPYTITTQYYSIPEQPFTANFSFYAKHGYGLPDTPPCDTTCQVDLNAPGKCLNPGRGGIQWCADSIQQLSDKVILSGHVVADDKLYFTGDVTIEGAGAPQAGVLTTNGDIYVKLKKGNETLLKGPGLSFDVDGPASRLLPRMMEDSATYFVGMEGVPLFVRGLPITLLETGVQTESIFYFGVWNMFTLAQCKATQLYPPGGKRALLGAEVVAMEASIAPSIKFMSMSLTYDPDQDKLEGKVSAGFPLIDGMWSVDLAIRVVQGCFNGFDLTLPLAAPIPVGTTGFGMSNVTLRQDGICVGQFTMFFGGDLNVLVPVPIPGEICQIKDFGIQYYYPLSFELKAGTTTIFGHTLGQTSGRINLNSASGTFKTSGNFQDILQGELRFDLIVPKAWFLGRYYGKLQIPDFQCAWTSLSCRTLKALVKSVVTLPFVIDEQGLEFNAQYKAEGQSYGFFRGMVNFPLIGSAAILVETRPGEMHLLIGKNYDNLFEVTESAPAVYRGLDSAERALVLSQPQGPVVFSAAADATIPTLYLKTPSGQTVTPANVSSFPGVMYASSDGEKVALFRVENAAAGTWVVGAENLTPDQVAFQALAPRPASATAFTSVTRNGNSVSISASVTPASAGTTVTLLYSRSDDGSAEGMIAQDLPATSGAVSATWDVSTLPTGTYYILARTDDGMNTPTLTVHATPIGVDQGLLQPPSNFAGSRSGNVATLSWTPSPSAGAAGYSVLFTDDPAVAGYPYTMPALRSDGTTLDKLDPAKAYRLCAVAYDADGNLSPQSNAITLPIPGGTPGDCDGDGAVSIGEVQKAINMFLGSLAPGCAVDANVDGTVTIGEVQKVINAFLGVVPGVSVSVAPSSVTVAPSATQQFAATVTGTTNTAVTWSVQEGSSGGSVTGAGLYTAPATPGIYHVKATSQVDPTKSGSATVTVSGGTCSVTCTASASPTTGAAPLTVNFSSTATPTNCSGSVTHAWTFGDGASSSQQDPSHAYASAGTYAWTMTASIGGQACSQSGSITVTSPPTCSLTCTASSDPPSGQAPLSVNFSATATPTNCSGSVAYAWTFGDGATSSQQNPSHTYTAAGTYAWTMTASIGGQACSKSGTSTVTSGGDGTPLTSGVPLDGTITGTTQNGSWNYYYLDLPAGVTGITVDLTGLSGDVDLYVRGGEKPDLDHFDCRSWEYGTKAEHCAVPLAGPQRVWMGVNNYLVGTFQYTIAATAGGGGACTLDACSAALQFDGLTVHFSGEYHAVACTGTPGFLWQFGDGSAAMEQNPSHTYASPGNYTFSFSVGIQDQTCSLNGDITVEGK